MPAILGLVALVVGPAAVILATLALVGSAVAMLAEHDPLVGRAR